MALNPRNQNKKRLSGAQQRKRARESKVAARKLAEELYALRKRDDAATAVIKPLDMTLAPRSYDEWRQESRALYWEMRKHRLALDDGRVLTWCAEVNGRLAKMSEELYELRQMNAQLQAINREAVEYLPASHQEDS